MGSAPLQIDSYLPLSDLSLDLVEQIERLAPFGQGNPALTLASKGLTLESHTTIGRTGEHLRLIVKDETDVTQKVLWWRGDESSLPQGRFDLAYAVQASDYRGQREVQVVWVDAREKLQVASSKLQVADGKRQVVDCRRESHPRALLERLREQEEMQVWSEAEARAEVAGRDRRELAPSQTIAIWTTPPGPAELQAALEKVSPDKVYLFGKDPDLDRPNVFLKHLTGLTKRATSTNEGRVSVSTLAAATAQREPTVRAGLAWLEARGHLAILDEEEDRYT